MHKSTSPRRISFKPYAILSTAIVGLGAAAALVSGVTPATAANLASQPDTQIAVFMVPLTILVIAILFEVTRFAMRGALPADAPRRRQPLPSWTPGHGEG